MLKVKEIFARTNNPFKMESVEQPLNAFITELERKGCKIRNITYLTDKYGYTQTAMVEYYDEEKDNG